MDQSDARPRSLRRGAAAALAALALAPTGSFAQSPGDTQYADPLGGGDDQGAQTQQPNGGDTPTSSDAPATPVAPDAAAPSPSAPAGAEPAATLPHTGANPLPLAVLGAALLAAGLLLRPRVAGPSR